MSVNARITANLAGRLTRIEDLGRTECDFEAPVSVAFVPGAGPGQANLAFPDTRTIAASANDDLDLAGGLTSPLGGALAFAAVKALLIRAAPGNTNNVVVGGASSNAFVGPFGAAAHTVAIRPGEALLLTSRTGWAVTAGTGDILRIANGGAGTPVSYDIVIIGH